MELLLNDNAKTKIDTENIIGIITDNEYGTNIQIFTKGGTWYGYQYGDRVVDRDNDYRKICEIGFKK